MEQLHTTVRNLVALYVAGSLTVGELAERLPDGWELDEAGDASELTLRVMGYVAEYERGDRSGEELRQVLVPEAAWLVERSIGSSAGLLAASEFSTRVSLAADSELQEVGA